MRQKQFIWLIIIGLSLSSCCCERHVREGRWIVDDFERKMAKEHSLKVVRRDGPRWQNERLRELSLGFSGSETLDVRGARRIAVLVTEELLDSFNSNPIVHPAGKGRPVTTYDVDLTIQFNTFFGQFVNPKTVRYLNVHDGYVTYYGFDCETSACGCSVEREPYDEAFRTIQRSMELAERLDNNEELEERRRERNGAYDPRWGIPLN